MRFRLTGISVLRDALSEPTDQGAAPSRHPFRTDEHLFLICAALGAAVLALQTILTLVGIDDSAGEADLSAGLDLLTVRAIAAGTAAFGLGGLAGMTIGLPAALSLAIGLVAGVGAAAGTAWLTRLLLGLEDSGSLQLERAIGHPATVQLSVPGASAGAGRVQFELQGRTLELKAVSPDGPIPTGTPVTIVGLVDGDTVEVVPTPTLEELIG